MTDLFDTHIETIIAWTDINIVDADLRERIQHNAKAFVNAFMDVELPTRNKIDIQIMSSRSFIAVSLIRLVRKTREVPDGDLPVFCITYSNDFYHPKGEPPKRLDLTSNEKNHRAMDTLTGQLKPERYIHSPLGRTSMQYIAAHRGSVPWERGNFEEHGKPRVWGYQGGVLMELFLDTRQMTTLCRYV